MKHLKLFEEVNHRLDFLVTDKVDIYDYDVEFLENIGFRRWNNQILLIPLSFFDKLKVGTEVISVTGDRKTIGKDYIDKDTRGGLMAYGLDIQKLKKEENEDYEKDVEWFD